MGTFDHTDRPQSLDFKFAQLQIPAWKPVLLDTSKAIFLLRFISAVSVLLLCTLSYAQDRPITAGAVTSATWQSEAVEVRAGAVRIRIRALSPSVFRVQYTTADQFPKPFSYAVVDKPEFPDGEPHSRPIDTSEFIGLATSQVQARIDRSSGRVIFSDASGMLVSQDAQPATFLGSEFRVARTMPVDEHYYGLGEKAGELDHRNQAFTMWNTDAFGWNSTTDPLYKSIPFFLALRNGKAYGLFLDNSYRTNFDFGKQSRDAYYFGADGGELDYYFFYGPNPKRVITLYTALTGRTPLPPFFTLGYQQCRYSYYPESRVREIANEFRARKIPADVIYLDIDYQKGYRAFEIDRERFPNFEGMVKDLAKQGFKTVVISDLHIAAKPGYSPYDQGVAGDHFIKRPDGSLYVGNVWPGESVFPDFTRKQTRDWYGSLYKDFTAMGIRGFWNDMNEPSVFAKPERTMPLDNVHRIEEPGYRRITDHREAHNLLGMQNVRATYEGLLKLQPTLRPFVLTRAAFAGTQRYAATWTGDNSATWEHYRLTLPTLLNLGVSGYAFAGNDIGGFALSPTPELFTRWMELGAFLPLYRDHASVGTRDKEPWVHGPEHEAIHRHYIETRYRLLPYIYTAMEENARTGVPLMRPVFIEYPASPVAADDKMFLFGRDLLIAPKLDETLESYEITLPPSTWFDYWTGKQIATPTLTLDPPLDMLPVFVRGGAIIPQQPLVQTTDETPQGPLELRIYPGNDCAGSIYADDGKSFDYRKGDYFRQNFTCEATSVGVKLSLAASEGTFKPWWTELKLVFAGSPEPKATTSVTLNSTQSLKAEFDANARTLTAEIPAPQPGKAAEVVLKY